MAKIVIEVPESVGSRADADAMVKNLVATALTHYRDYLQQSMEELDGLPQNCKFLVNRHFVGAKRTVGDELMFFEAIVDRGNIFFER